MWVLVTVYAIDFTVEPSMDGIFRGLVTVGNPAWPLRRGSRTRYR